jgi:NAD(P)-dependent dehydrogenase (short-subunit alcohol dehydrogenase family)
MVPKKREIEGSVAVITGGSSGIGRATAGLLAERGADVVLGARSESKLQEVAQECERMGGRALAVPTDVADEPAVQALADRALARFGRIDAWVNNAGVIAYGNFENTPSEAYEQVIRTNLFGQIYGARAALRAFRRRGSGVLVNLSSIWGRITSPYVGAYVVSKHGVRAFSECIRQGLNATPGSDDIHVCTILPESIDTPIFRHAANYVGRPIKPVPPVEDTGTAAKVIVSCIERPRLEVTVGAAGHIVQWATAPMPPGLYNRLVPWLFEKVVFESGDVERNSGNLFEPEPDLNQVYGGWRDHEAGRRARRVALAAAFALPVAGAAFATGRAIRRR